MSTLEDAKNLLDDASKKVKKVKNKLDKSSKNIWWEVGAYAIQASSIIIPVSIIATIQDAWVKTGITFGVSAGILALVISFWQLIKKFNEQVPGAIPFIILCLVGLFMNMTGRTLVIVSICGLVGSIGAWPLHAKYKQTKTDEKSAEVIAIEELTERLTGSKDENSK